jgi:ribose/xylose/arabinose/galactoside ABC-type transport system permease subunit
VGLLGVLWVVVGVVNPAFATTNAARDVLLASAPVLIVALGVSLVILAGEIDISVGSMYGTLAAVLALLSSPTFAGWPAWAVCVVVVSLGVLMGVMNGVLVAWAGVPAIVATLGTMSILRGATELLLGGTWITDLPEDLRMLGTGSWVGVPVMVWVAVAVLAGGLVLTRRTALGVRLAAVGDRAEAAAYARVRVAWVRVAAFAMCGGLVGVAAAVSVPQLSVVESGLGGGLELAAITAAVVGGVSISGGSGSLAGVAAAVVLLAGLRSSLVYLQIGESATAWEPAIYGACLLGAVALDSRRGRAAAGVAEKNRGRSVAWLPPVILIVGTAAAAGWLSPDFLSWGTQGALAPQASEIALLALAMLPVLLTGGIDLSVGSAMALSSVCAGVLAGMGAPAWVCVAAALGSGASCGLFNGALIALWRIHPLVVTLATLSLFRGVAQGITGGRPLGPFEGWWTWFGSVTVVGVPMTLLPAACVAGGLGLVLWRGVLGAGLRGMGDNAVAAGYCGLPVVRWTMAAYTFSGAMAGMAACVFIARRNTAKADVGVGMELDVITACVLGGVSLAGARGGVWGVLAGVTALHGLRQFVAWRWYHDELILIVLGAALVLGVVLAGGLRRTR